MVATQSRVVKLRVLLSVPGADGRREPLLERPPERAARRRRFRASAETLGVRAAARRAALAGALEWTPTQLAALHTASFAPPAAAAAAGGGEGGGAGGDVEAATDGDMADSSILYNVAL